jgi:hypothetical protein
MNTIKIVITGVAPLSSNKLKPTNRYGRYYKSNEKKLFQDLVYEQLEKYIDEFKAFKRTFNKKDEYIVGDFHYTVPRDKFYNKDGSMKQTRIDLTNCKKALEDCIFRKLGVNDCFRLGGDESMRPGNDYKFTVVLTNMPRDFD